jgi:uncharacterized protein (DUF362 family)
MSRRTLLRQAGAVAASVAVARLGPARPAAAARVELPHRSAAAPSAPVAIGACPDYELGAVTARLAELFDLVGGIGDLVNRKWVTVKVNLTGTAGQPMLGRPPNVTYQTHFNVALALAGLLHQAGARHVRFVESIYDDLSPAELFRRSGWDWHALQAAGGDVSFEDTRNLGSYASYARLAVPWGGYLFPAYELNRAYEETDVFVSLAKLKNHADAGVTLATKNSFGITPLSLYGDDAGSEGASKARLKILHHGALDPPSGAPAELRGDSPREPSWRVPRVIADVLGIRPIDLAIVDGIETVAGGEGPWVRANLRHVTPGLLLVGHNAVCTDAVAMDVMGYDPRAEAGAKPFPGDNHLELAARAGLGTNDPSQIEVRGLSIDQVRVAFG